VQDLTKKKVPAVPSEQITQSIVLLRGQKVLLDSEYRGTL
jgi:hypothetical protein